MTLILINLVSILINQVNMVDLNLFGPIEIHLDQGWNMIGYYLTIPKNVITQFADVEDDIEVVKDNSGLIYWPEFGFNNIGELIPGQGYKVYMNSSGTLIFE